MKQVAGTGYVHMEDLPLYEVFGDGVLERIPEQSIWLETRTGL